MNIARTFNPTNVNQDLLDEELKLAGFGQVIMRLDNFEVHNAAIADGIIIDAILAAHDYTIKSQEEKEETTRANAKTQFSDIPTYAKMTEAEAVLYIGTNVTDLASAKIVLIALARMVIALRNDRFPDLEGR